MDSPKGRPDTSREVDGVRIEAASEGASLRVRVSEISVDGHAAMQIEVQGPFPVEAYFETADFLVSVFDCTDGNLHPVLATMEAFQERSTIAYGSRVPTVRIRPRSGIHPWAPVGLFIPEIMLGPYGGRRRLMAVVRLVRLDTDMRMVHGRVVRGMQGVLWTGKFRFRCALGENGYVELEQVRRNAHAVAVKLAATVAIADGTLDTAEVEVVQQKIEQWIGKADSIYDGMSETPRSESYKAMVKRALDEARRHQADLSVLLQQLRRNGDPQLWYETIELCYDVMAADGIADANELRILREIGDASGVDMKEIEKLRDRKIVGLDIKAKVDAPVEELLGIGADWDRARIRKHLRAEYKKWNGRLNTVP